jgi:hypothetical protein
MEWQLIVFPALIFGPMLAIAIAALLRRRRMSIEARVAEQAAADEAQRRVLEIARRSPVDAMYPHSDPGVHNIFN